MANGKVTGIGGILYKSNDPEKTKEWYRDNLGFNVDEYGTSFQWLNNDGDKGHTVWSPMAEDHEHFEGGEKDMIVNLRVDNLDDLLDSLKSEGVEILGPVKEYEYGRFAYVKDPDGMKLELWEPNDQAYEEMAENISQ